jgi:hypothetical protein
MGQTSCTDWSQLNEPASKDWANASPLVFFEKFPGLAGDGSPAIMDQRLRESKI